jgi:3-hydroxybutyryl-CoA dehydrogenase
MSSPGPLDRDQAVAIIGCGAMGTGIAQVAATYGHEVRLFDIRPGAADRAKTDIDKQLSTLVAKRKITALAASSAIERLRPMAALEEVAGSALVIEAIQEDLAVKRSTFAAIEPLLAEDVILATNTSSLSVTAIAASLKRPGQLCGMHFFNPAPLMPLVEVIRGVATEDSVIDQVYATAVAWGKTPVRAISTPGFIVNRVARPFYAEALRVLQEGGADAATLDAIMRESGGFRMGPFELMDLIGHDVNFAVTCSVHAAFFGDPRFTPSLFQRELVEAGHLGRKTGRGVYDYRVPLEPQKCPREFPEFPPPARIQAGGDLGPASCLIDMAETAGLVVEETEFASGRIVIDGIPTFLSDGRSATARAAAEGMRDLVVFDLAKDYRTCTRIALAAAEQASAEAATRVAAFFRSLGKKVSPLNDVPGMIVMRTVAMLVNEAADTVLHGVASPADVDLAMVKGTNYPAGPLAWGDSIGPARILGVLRGLQESYGEDRYRASQYLRKACEKSARVAGD